MRRTKLARHTPMCRPAFTLIELLITVAIIAILAAIAVPNFLEAHTRAKVARAQADMRTLALGLAAYRFDTNRVPFDGDDVDPLDTDLWDTRFGLQPITTPISYLTSIPLAPSTFINELNPPESQQRVAYEWATTRFVVEGTMVVGGGGAGYKPTASAQYWIAWSGPDKRLDYPDFRRPDDGNAPGNGFTIPHIAARARNYDASNGTVSPGDVVRWGP